MDCRGPFGKLCCLSDVRPPEEPQPAMAPPERTGCFSQLLDQEEAGPLHVRTPLQRHGALYSALPPPGPSHHFTGSWAMVKLSVTLTEPLHMLGILQSQE